METGDYGARCADTFLRADLLNHRRRSEAMASAGPSGDCCLDCGEPIDEERRAAMEKMGMRCDLCITCKEKSERRSG